MRAATTTTPCPVCLGGSVLGNDATGRTRGYSCELCGGTGVLDVDDLPILKQHGQDLAAARAITAEEMAYWLARGDGAGFVANFRNVLAGTDEQLARARKAWRALTGMGR